MPTRSSRFNASLIDQMYCKLDNPDLHSISCIIKTIISNHYPYFTLLDMIKNNKQPKYVKMNNANEESFRNFCEEIKDTMNNMNKNTNLFHDPDHNCGIFERIISDAKRNTFPKELWNLTETSTKFHPGRHQEFCAPSSIGINFTGNWNLPPPPPPPPPPHTHTHTHTLILRCMIPWNTTWTHTVVFLKSNQTCENGLLLTPIW